MRRWAAWAVAVAAATVVFQSRPGGAAPKKEPPHINIWDRAGAWTTATTATADDFGFAFHDLRFAQDGSSVVGTFEGGTARGDVFGDGTSAVLSGVFHFDDGYAPDAKFSIRLNDKKTYNTFKGQVEYTGGEDKKPQWRPFVGTYKPDSAVERGEAHLDLQVYVAKPKHNLSPKNAKNYENLLVPRNTPFKVAFVVVVKNLGLETGGAMVPDGTLEVVVRAGPNVGLALSSAWSNQRATIPGTYKGVGDAWEMRVPLRALGTTKDYAFFAVQADMSPEFIGDGLHLSAKIESRAPNLDVTTEQIGNEATEVVGIIDPI